MTSLDEIFAQAENPAFARITTARVLLRQDLAVAHAELEEVLVAAATDDQRLNREPVAPSVAAQIEALEAEIEAAKVEFRFRPIGKRAWSDLIAQHPPTKDQLRRDARLDHDPTTFPIAAIAASAVEPTLTFDDAARLERVMNQAQFEMLWARVLEANLGGVATPKSQAAGLILRASARSASTAAIEESHDPSSSDE